MPASASTIPTSGSRRAVLYVCFFLSGAAGLIYQVVWARYLALFLGATGAAHIIVLSSFMGGLALGAWAWGRVADRMAEPLKLFVYLELGIALYAVTLFEPSLAFARTAYLYLAGLADIQVGHPGMTAAKLVAAAITLLPPTFLMGGTLPALSRHLAHSGELIGPRVSFLYFLNSVGAAAGCVLAGFHLVPTYGLHASLLGAALLNGLAGLAAMGTGAVASRTSADEGAVMPAPVPLQAPPAPLSRGALFVLLLASGISGAISMVYEVAWIRMLTLALGSSTYSFSLMLGTFIFGLGLGGLLLSARRSRREYAVIFGLAQLGVGLTVLISLYFYVRLPYWFNLIATSLARRPDTFSLYQFAQFLLCAMVMIVPTILQGITFPAAIGAVSHHVQSLGRRLGLVMAVNTVGAVAGTLFAGFIALPRLELKGTLELAIAVNGALAVLILLAAPSGAARRKSLAIAIAAIALAASWRAIAPPPWSREILMSGSYRNRARLDSFQMLALESARRETLFYKDGLDATVAVQDVALDLGQRVLNINGKVDATTIGDLLTQKLMGHLPVLIHPDPKTAFVVGLGSGATIGSLATYELERVDFVEILPEVFEASRLFDSVNGRYWEDPRIHGYCEDAKTFLAITKQPYDIIVSEPTNPWIAGVANVFSREFYEQCRDRLAPGGLFVQWIQIYDLEDPVFFSMVETLTGVFPHYTIWNGAGADTIFVASLEPYEPDFDHMEALLQRPAVAADLEMVRIRGLLPLMGQQMLDRSNEPSHVAWTGIIHSDYFPYLDFAAPRGFFLGASPAGVRWFDDRKRSPANAALWIHEAMKWRPPDSAAIRQGFEFAFGHPELPPDRAYMWAALLHDRHPDEAGAKIALGSVSPPDHSRAAGLLGEGAEESGLKEGFWIFESVSKRYQDYMATRNALAVGDAAALLADIETLLDAEDGPEPTPALLVWRGALLHDLGRHGEGAEFAVAGLLEMERQPALDMNAVMQAALLACEARLADNDPSGAMEVWERWLEPMQSRFDARMMGSLIRSKLAGASAGP